MLARENQSGAWELWHGVNEKMQRFDNPPPGNEFGRLTARVVERLLKAGTWTQADLDKYRIRQALDMSPPDGKQFVANAATLAPPDPDDGTIIRSWQLEDAPPPPPPPTEEDLVRGALGGLDLAMVRRVLTR